jgi:hypothetical protein
MDHMRKTIGTFLLSALVIASAAASGPIDVKLTLDEASVLPRMPTGLTITVTNGSDKGLHLPSAIFLLATNEAGETVVLNAYSGSMAVAHVAEAERDIAPGASHEFRFDAESVSVGSPWLVDSRLSKPGTYRLRAVFGETQTDPGAVIDNVTQQGEFDRSNGLFSDVAMLRVAVVSDEDRAVWQWLKDRPGEGPIPTGFPSFVIDQHPQSGYALYASVWYGPTDFETKATLMQGVIKRFKPSPFTEQVQLNLLQRYRIAAMDSQGGHRVKEAADRYQKARDLAADLIENAHSAVVRKQAKGFLETTPTHEEVLHPQPPEKEN